MTLNDLVDLISIGEALTGIFSIAMGVVFMNAGIITDSFNQTILRLWIGVYFTVMGVEEVFDAMYTEGTASAIAPQLICTIVQLITSMGAAAFLLRARHRFYKA